MSKLIVRMKRISIFIRLFFCSLIHSKELKLVTENRIIGKVILVCVLKNDKERIQYFLEYYRCLGIDSFIFVDNDSNDGFFEKYKNSGDITIFHSKASYKKSNFGMHWANYILRKYCNNKWVVVCDSDEFIVYPKSEVRDIKELVELLELRNQKTLPCMLLDMYGNGSIEDMKYTEGQDPLEVTPYFDKSGYQASRCPFYGSNGIKGGVRQRVYFKDNIQCSPALNKYPLVKWKPFYAYIFSMHILFPMRLNAYGERFYISGVILHFKFLQLIKNKVTEEEVKKQHWNNSIEYKEYQKVGFKANLYHEDMSIKYEGSSKIQELGLMQSGNWE